MALALKTKPYASRKALLHRVADAVDPFTCLQDQLARPQRSWLKTRHSSSFALPQSNTRKMTTRRALDGKVYFSYEDIHDAVSSSVARVKAFKPDVIVAIGGGGFIPARMLRTEVKVPIVAVGLELYDDNTNTINENGVQIKQWFSTDYGPGALVENGRVLIVDEVDDTRTTLAACVSELRKRHKPSQVGCLVVHNKLKAKRASLPTDVTYIACEEVPDEWNCYPWDAAAYGLTARAHTKRAGACRGGVPVVAIAAAVGALAALLRR